MTPLYFFVDVDIKRVPLASRWASEHWLPSAVVPLGAVTNEANSDEERKSAMPQRIADNALATTWRFSGFAIELHTTEAQGLSLIHI